MPIGGRRLASAEPEVPDPQRFAENVPEKAIGCMPVVAALIIPVVERAPGPNVPLADPLLTPPTGLGEAGKRRPPTGAGRTWEVYSAPLVGPLSLKFM